MVDLSPLDKIRKNNNEVNEGKISPIDEKDKYTNKLKKDILEAKKVYSIHQDNIRISETLQAEILKGVKNNEEITPLFLKAVKVISLMTGTELFYTQINDVLNKWSTIIHTAYVYTK